MFITLDKLKKAIKELQNDISNDATNKLSELKKEIEELKLKKRLEEEEIKHLVKMKEEKNFIEAQKKEIELAKKFNEREMEFERDYYEKVLKECDDQRKELKELYLAIMDRLPNVNVDIKKG